MVTPTRHAFRGEALLLKLPPMQAALLALGIVHAAAWVARYFVVAWEERVVEANPYTARRVVAPATVQECIYVSDMEPFRGYLFAIPPHKLEATEAYCPLCSKPFEPAQKPARNDSIPVPQPLWRFRCGHTYDIECLQARFKKRDMGCAVCAGEVQLHQRVSDTQETQVMETKDPV